MRNIEMLLTGTVADCVQTMCKEAGLKFAIRVSADEYKRLSTMDGKCGVWVEPTPYGDIVTFLGIEIKREGV